MRSHRELCATRSREPEIRWAVCYYSGLGNTKLACEFIAARLGHPVDLIDITTSSGLDLACYDAVGLATFTDFGGIPELFVRYLRSLPAQADKPAFCLNTYGFASGRSAADLAAAASRAGFSIFASHSLRMPESYPPMISLGLGFPSQPDDSRARVFERFVDVLPSSVSRHLVVKVPLLSRLTPPRPRTTARDDMGEKRVDADSCTRCGTCERGCPYHAITLSPLPVFDQSACYGCWRCYNRCPSHAISTRRFTGPYYPQPPEHARMVLGQG
jgi:NAD-dependent dihydropyrimidine dehydrogenase PreA subunit